MIALQQLIATKYQPLLLQPALVDSRQRTISGQTSWASLLPFCYPGELDKLSSTAFCGPSCRGALFHPRNFLRIINIIISMVDPCSSIIEPRCGSIIELCVCASQEVAVASRPNTTMSSVRMAWFESGESQDPAGRGYTTYN